MNYIYLSIIVLLAGTCKKNENKSLSLNDSIKKESITEIVSNDKVANIIIDDTTFVNLKDYSQDFVYDMKYATEDNFLKAKVYDCAECYLRLKTVRALVEANKDFIAQGYRIKLYDCYRPLDIQKRMWKIVSNPQYVADPAKGSIHNRGGAVDLTLVDAHGTELDMGTSFDHFGIEASHSYQKLDKAIIKNRRLLKETMVKHNFKIFESEWWHYNMNNASADKLSNFKWKCN
ncbi:MAG: peptidase M15 [Pedobacter sp.]|nr:MAG: peptidase M15 [Pedobacter sp.]